MTNVGLVIREAEADWSGGVDADRAERVIAALSADPATLADLASALHRFEAKPARSVFAKFSQTLDLAPRRSGLLVVDLAARLIYVDSPILSAPRCGRVPYFDGRNVVETLLTYHLDPEWLAISGEFDWQPVAAARRRERAARLAIDARAVLYGRPMIEFLARQTLAAFAWRATIEAEVRQAWAEEEGDLSPEEAAQAKEFQEQAKDWPVNSRDRSPFYGTLSGIHAEWLLAVRDDLGGQCPRDVLATGRSRLDRDLQDRGQDWSALGRCPPGLSESSWAFSHGAFGTHEIVEYYGLVRELLWSCWERLTALAAAPNPADRPDAWSEVDFLADEAARLQTVRDAWLDAPDAEFHGRTPREVIRRERRRIPETASASDTAHDPDCPCCQMLIDGPGPCFLHLDGSNMDDDFAFDFSHRTRDGWQTEQNERDRFSMQMAARQEAERDLGLPSPYSSESRSGFWARTFVVGRQADVPLGVRIFGVGCRLAEVIAALRIGFDRHNLPAERAERVELLNRHFANLRQILGNKNEALTQALIDPVLDGFCEALESAAADFDETAAACEIVIDDLRELLGPSAVIDPDNPLDLGEPI